MDLGRTNRSGGQEAGRSLAVDLVELEEELYTSTHVRTIHQNYALLHGEIAQSKIRMLARLRSQHPPESRPPEDSPKVSRRPLLARYVMLIVWRC